MTKYKKVNLEVEPNISTRQTVCSCAGCGRQLFEREIAIKLQVNHPNSGQFVYEPYCSDCKQGVEDEGGEYIVKRRIER